MKQQKIEIYTVVNLLLILLALTTIGLGIYMTPDNGFFGEFLIALGGTLFGTAVGGVISHFKNKDFFDSVLKILTQNQKSKIHSDENLITEFKANWHVYYLTINENGEKFWNYYNMNFSSSLAPGILSTEIEVRDNDGINHKYVMQGLRHESKGPLIIFTKGKNSEEREAIMILPNIGKKYQKYIFGFDFIETWNGQSVISPTIISRNKINGSTRVIVDGKTSQKLEMLWEEYSSKNLHYITKK